ncbi:hypothetical protein ACFOVU_03820 [Nocardiopsis sediminis]|uniref:DUF3558 domain-containing protein n=1 Tax=Nocardiopsis sediminis TaxID=1778267 RepID=A0ABV8FGU8_9ACTN
MPGQPPAHRSPWDRPEPSAQRSPWEPPEPSGDVPPAGSPPPPPGPSRLPSAGGAPVRGPDFPGEPGGPLPEGAVRPPGRGRALAGAAAALAAVAVAVPLALSLTGPRPAYGALGACADLLPDDVVAEIPATGGHTLGGGPSYYYGEAEPGVDESLFCSATRDDESPALFTVIVLRYLPETRDADYAEPRAHVTRALAPIERGLAGASAAPSVDTGDDLVADVELRDLPAGDGGHAVSYADPRSANPAVAAQDDWAEATFSTRNIAVDVIYRGTPDMDVDAKLDAAALLATTVADRIGATLDTV